MRTILTVLQETSGWEVADMLYNPISNYPDSIDPMIFFQDIDLTQAETMEAYDRLISQGRYCEASELISGQEGIHGFFSDYLNAIENRIHSLQEHLLALAPKQPFVSSDNEPAADNQIIWI